MTRQLCVTRLDSRPLWLVTWLDSSTDLGDSWLDSDSTWLVTRLGTRPKWLVNSSETSFGFFGFSWVVFNWMRSYDSYLIGRRQYVRYNGSTSSVTVMQFHTWPIVFRSRHYWCVLNCWRAGVLHPWIHRWSADLWSLPRQKYSPAHQSTHCIKIVGRWMSSNRPRLNPSKTEFIWLGSTRRLARCTFDPIIIGRKTIQPSQMVHDLGAYIDSSIGFAEHVTRMVRTCYFHICQLRSIRRSLTIESSHALVRALVLTCPD